jgi:hypothetical protein
MPFTTTVSLKFKPRCASLQENFQVHHFFSKIPNPRLRLTVLTTYYLLIIGAVIYVQLRENFTTPAFIYLNF